MQHLTAPDGSGVDIKVPYYATGYIYDGQQSISNFSAQHWDQYPDRAGYPWLRGNITVQEMNHHCRQSLSHELRAFAQTWMFFGLLHEILGSQYREADFITDADQDGARHITTEHIKSWKLSQTQGDRMILERPGYAGLEVNVRWSKALLQRALARSILWDRFAMDKDESWAELSLSFKMIVEIFTTTPKQIGGEFEVPMELELTAHAGAALDWIKFNLLGDSRIWCIHQVNRLCSTLSYSALVYVAVLARASRIDRSRVDHKNCANERVCKAYDINIGVDAKPIHTTEDCNCKDVEASREERDRILDRGGIPVLSCVKKHGEFTLRFKPASPWMKYAAISHLWADGLGNVFENTLPRCQVSRVYRALRFADARFHVAGQPEVLLWLDVYCIPAQVPPASEMGAMDAQLELQRQRDRDLKKRAIARMDATYSWANYVLVLDQELARTVTQDRALRQPSGGPQADAPIQDITVAGVASMAICPWNSRCWTYQEHSLARRTLLLGDDCQSLFDEYSSELAVERHLYQQLLLLIGRRSLMAGGVKADISHDWSLNQGMEALTDSSSFGLAWNAFYGRSTTQWDDMIVVLANMSNLSAREVLRLDPTMQMKAVLASQKSLPLSLLFVEMDRLGDDPQDGRLSSLEDRWVPARPQSVQLTWPKATDTKEAGLVLDSRTSDLMEVGPGGILLDSAKLRKYNVFVIQLPLLGGWKIPTNFRYPTEETLGTYFWVQADQRQMDLCLDQCQQMDQGSISVVFIMQLRDLCHTDSSAMSRGACLLSIHGKYRNVQSAVYVCPIAWGKRSEAAHAQPLPMTSDFKILIVSDISSWPKLLSSRSKAMNSLRTVRSYLVPYRFYPLVATILIITCIVLLINYRNQAYGWIWVIPIPIILSMSMIYVVGYAFLLQVMYSVHSEFDAEQHWWRRLQEIFRLMPFREAEGNHWISGLVLRAIVWVVCTLADMVSWAKHCSRPRKRTIKYEEVELQESLHR